MYFIFLWYLDWKIYLIDTEIQISIDEIIQMEDKLPLRWFCWHQCQMFPLSVNISKKKCIYLNFRNISLKYVWKRSIGSNKSECWKSEYSISHFPQNYLFPFGGKGNEIRLLTNSRQKQNPGEKLKFFENCKILFWVLHSILSIICRNFEWKLKYKQL